MEPLRQRVRENGGQVYPGGPEFTLLIDIRSDPEATYLVLRDVLREYSDIVTVFREGEVDAKNITVIVSGRRPRALMAAELVRYAALDGRLSDLDTPETGSLFPLISDDWSKVSSYKGTGVMAPEDEGKLAEIVRKAHDHGRRVRFWATPDHISIWQRLISAGVDLIGTDDLGALHAFLVEYSGETESSLASYPQVESLGGAVLVHRFLIRGNKQVTIPAEQRS